jgi:hypothetical protein
MIDLSPYILTAAMFVKPYKDMMWCLFSLYRRVCGVAQVL